MVCSINYHNVLLWIFRGQVVCFYHVAWLGHTAFYKIWAYSSPGPRSEKLFDPLRSLPCFVTLIAISNDDTQITRLFAFTVTRVLENSELSLCIVSICKHLHQRCLWSCELSYVWWSWRNSCDSEHSLPIRANFSRKAIPAKCGGIKRNSGGMC